jgi:hypothetical protein
MGEAEPSDCIMLLNHEDVVTVATTFHVSLHRLLGWLLVVLQYYGRPFRQFMIR